MTKVAVFSGLGLACPEMPSHPPRMFAVSEAEAAAIRTLFEHEGEFAAAMELRRIFPLITDNGKAREFARIIAGWQPIVLPATRGGRPIRAKTHAKEGP